MVGNTGAFGCRVPGGLLTLLLLLAGISGRGQSAADNVRIIALKAVPGLQFDTVRFRVKPGTRLQIRLTNVDDMAHNLVITRPGARREVVDAALQLGDRGPALHYIPPSSKILWSIPVVLPEETASLALTAPQEPGVYPYVCTFPGHGFVMYGAMYVTDGPLPALKDDLAVPDSRRPAVAAAAHAGHGGMTPKRYHPYEPKPPFLYRIFMPDAGPAAIAVSLPRQLSYCWDAGACRLRYAWEGGFLDQSTLWPGKGDSEAALVGSVFFRDGTPFPLRLGGLQPVPAVAYKGYQLINRYPEFHYTLNGQDVYELIRENQSGTGLVRTFKIPRADRSVWFMTDPQDGVRYQCPKGKWVDGNLLLSAAEAREFTVTLTKKEE